MTVNLSHLLAGYTPKPVKLNSKANRTIKKCKRKLRKARTAKSLTELRILIGMARVALDKAERIARMTGKE